MRFLFIGYSLDYLSNWLAVLSLQGLSAGLITLVSD